MKFQIVGMLAVNIVAASSDGRRPRPRLFYGRGQAAATIVTATIPSSASIIGIEQAQTDREGWIIQSTVYYSIPCFVRV